MGSLSNTSAFTIYTPSTQVPDITISINNNPANKSEPFSNVTVPLFNIFPTSGNGNVSQQTTLQEKPSETSFPIPFELMCVGAAVILLCVLIFLAWCSGLQLKHTSRSKHHPDGWIEEMRHQERPDALSIIGDTVTMNRHFYDHEENMPIMDTPSSIYPADLLPGNSDSTRNLHSDTITTPLSNNSIITMTMKNNYLIVETEERIPVDCSTLSPEELYRYKYCEGHSSQYPCDSAGNIEFHNEDIILEDPNSSGYSDDQPSSEIYSSVPPPNVHEHDRRSFLNGPTTSKQAQAAAAYEEDHHVEMFHKNISAYSGYPATVSSMPSVSQIHSSSFELQHLADVCQTPGFPSPGISPTVKGYYTTTSDDDICSASGDSAIVNPVAEFNELKTVTPTNDNNYMNEKSNNQYFTSGRSNSLTVEKNANTGFTQSQSDHSSSSGSTPSRPTTHYKYGNQCEYEYDEPIQEVSGISNKRKRISSFKLALHNTCNNTKDDYSHRQHIDHLISTHNLPSTDSERDRTESISSGACGEQEQVPLSSHTSPFISVQEGKHCSQISCPDNHNTKPSQIELHLVT